MACGLGLGVLLICLVQAELGCCSWANEVMAPRHSYTHAGFPLPDGRLRNFNNFLQNQLRQGSISPRSGQTSSSNTSPGQRLSTSSFLQAVSQPVQSSGRLVKNSFMSKPNSQSTATLFGPVAPGPRSSVRIQTYAQAPARKIVPGRISNGAKARRFSPQTAAETPNVSPQFALNVGGYRPRSQLLFSRLAVPRSSRVGESAPGYAPVMIHEIPEPFGSSAIRRLKQPTEKVPVQRQQQFYALPQWVPPYKPDLSLLPGSEWTRIEQKPQQTSTPPRWVPAYNPDLPSVHPVSRWTKVKLPYRL
ncbi:hypothetical protein CRENBAI_008661 [Crenichthys baileyi]|uniref:Uncharacterized protein n=1 Tax=Crenichthys baileyi TaxID=28760 RepID=A0AAV9QR19_9TELE